MTREAVIEKLRVHESELRAAGIEKLSLFGSVARGDDNEESQVDIAIVLDPAKTPSGFRYFGLLDDLEVKLEGILNRFVDVIDERSAKKIKADLDRDRVVAF